MSAKVVEGITDDDIIQQMKDLREELKLCGRKQGEFTALEYAKINEIDRSKARRELILAKENGLVEVRNAGRLVYWRFVK